MTSISVVINTLNEEKNLPRVLASIKNFADETVVIDMRSDDRTVEIAAKFGAKVFGHERTGYVEPARNFAISKAGGDWILILDADEALSVSLKKRLKKIIEDPDADYYRLPRKNIIFGKWVKHSRWWPDYNIRFFRKGSVTWNEVIHSVPLTQGRGADIKAKEKNAIIHYHYESIEQFIGRLNRYTTEHAELVVKNGYRFDWTDLIKKPVNEFLSRYFYADGYKDGLHGLALAGLQGFSEFILYLKIWQKENFADHDIRVAKTISLFKNSQKDLNYWTADTLLKETGSIIYRIKRKLKIG